MTDYTVTFATLNCIDYTQKCLASLIASGTDESKIVVVDNASTDGTQAYLARQKLGGCILNRENLSCGAAWNQGILARQSEWTIVMNNDIVVSKNFAENLIQYAVDNDLKIVSPARVDGLMDYDYYSFAETAQNRMSSVVRHGTSNAVCMCIHWSLFQEIGFFRATPKLLGYEDAIFFKDVRDAKIANATTGSVWIHHFGSVTQHYMKMALGIPTNEVLLKVNGRRLLNQTWLERKIYRQRLKKLFKDWRRSEFSAHQMTLHGVRQNNEFIWL